MSSRLRRTARPLLCLLLVVAGLAACGGSSPAKSTSRGSGGVGQSRLSPEPPLPGPIAPPTGPPFAPTPAGNVYAYDRASGLSPTTKGAQPRVYVPNSDSNTVDVVDPVSFKVVDHFPVGRNPQHVVPSWDLKTLWVTNDLGNSVTALDPNTGRLGRTVPVDDPYNMYFTPDGRYAVVVAEQRQRLDFRDAHTMALVKQVPVNCAGVDHVDFSADLSFLVATCEFAGKLVRVDLASMKVTGYLTVTGQPQDIKLDPAGETFYVADQVSGGLFVIDAKTFTKTGFLPTGKGTHGLYPSRDGALLYASNRREASVSVIDFKTRQVVAKWPIPGKSMTGKDASPDMGGVSADGKVLWLTGRYSAEVYAIDTGDGHLIQRVRVGDGPHGACVWPQPGRYSLGHTGILR